MSTLQTQLVKKTAIIESGDFNLSANRYLEKVEINSIFPAVLLFEHAEFLRGTSKSKKDFMEGEIPVVAGGMQPAYYCNESNRDENMITISSSGANAGFVNFYSQKIFASDCFTVNANKEVLNQKFLYNILKVRQDEIFNMQTGGGQPHVYIKNFDQFKIPLPPLEIQEQIVKEIESFENQIKINKKENIELEKKINDKIKELF